MRNVLKTIGSGIKNFMIIFSFIVNLVLLIVVVVLALLLFDIKKNIAEPLVMGLHSSFVGLDEATIDWTIPVRDTIPITLNIPLETDTVVTLTEAVPLTVNAVIVLPGVGTLNNAQVNLQLPAGLDLPVHLDLNVPVQEDLDIALDVRAVIPIAETQLHDAIDNLRLLFDPLTRGLYNLPDNFEEAGTFAGEIVNGNLPNLLADNPYNSDPWPGYSQTAGLGYQLGSEPVPSENLPLETGIVPMGGIPALDEQIRPEIYEGEGGPAEWNARVMEQLQAMGIAPAYYNGSYAADIYSTQRESAGQPPADMGMQPVETTQPPADTSGSTAGAGTVDNPAVVPAQPVPLTPVAPDTNVQAAAPSQQEAAQAQEVVPQQDVTTFDAQDAGQGGGMAPEGDMGILATQPP